MTDTRSLHERSSDARESWVPMIAIVLSQMIEREGEGVDRITKVDSSLPRGFNVRCVSPD